MHNHKNLKIWQRSMDIVEIIYRETLDLPVEERYGLTSQIRRASISIPSNIAEGCSRNSKIELARILEIAIGSSFELESQIEVCRLLTYINESHSQLLIAELNVLQRQMNLYREMVRK